MEHLLSDRQLAKFTLPQFADFQLLHTTLVQPDGTLTPRGWGVLSALISSLVCFVLYKATRPFSHMLFPSYRKLSREDQRNWDSRYSSNVHAVLCVLFAYEIDYKSDFFWKPGPVPLVLRTSAQTYIALGVSFGYFAVDFVSCVKYNMGGAEMVLHHFGSLFAVTTALITGDCHMHTLWMLATEFTTPLINNRWWLDKMDMKTSQLYVINGVAILFSWIFARLSVFPPFFYILWTTRDQLALITPVSIALAAAVPLILAILNTYWFMKIVKGVYKVLFGKKKAD